MELIRKPASASNNGELESSAAQTISGAKTFTGAITPTGGIVGKTDGAAVAAGYVGERIESIGTGGVNQTGVLSGNLIFNTAGAPALSLPAGTWLITGFTSMKNNSVTDAGWLRLYDNTAAAAFGGGFSIETNTTSFLGVSCAGVLTFSGANRTVYLAGFRNGGSTLVMGIAAAASAAPCGYLVAVRIA